MAVAVEEWYVIKMSHPGLSTQSLILRVLTVMYPSSDCRPVQKEASVTKAEISPSLSLIINIERQFGNVTFEQISLMNFYLSFYDFSSHGLMTRIMY